MVPGSEGDNHVAKKVIHREIPLSLSMIMSDGLSTVRLFNIWVLIVVVIQSLLVQTEQ